MATTRALLRFACAAAAAALAPGLRAATTDLATTPLVTSSTTSVLPNIMYVLDDSGSMGWNFMPDWACNPTLGNNTNSDCGAISARPANYAPPGYLFYNSDFNGIYYNPAIVYTPPTYYNADGTVNTATYPAMAGTSAATGGDSSASGASPNWKAVKNDGYGVQATGTTNLESQAFYYLIIPGEYCTSASLRSCTAATAPTGSYTYPARLRWCNSSALTSCKATFGDPGNTYTWFRAPAPVTATITVGGTSLAGTSVTGITVNGQQILPAATAASTSTSTIASAIANGINACTLGLTGNCQAVGYAARASGSTVTVSAPAAITYTPVATKSGGTITVTATAFAAGSVPGSNVLTVIARGYDSYVYPGTAAKSSARTDCAGATCTYAEEMTNFANWWAYYRTRMQMMKTAISTVFASVGPNYRVGYMSINNNTGSDYLDINPFTSANKLTWYNKFFSAEPNSSTPLRVALSKAGRLFANDIASINGQSVTDPMQYSCQQNFSIVSTDGYWNEPSNPVRLGGTTAIGNQDSIEPRPFNDGGSSTQTVTIPWTYVLADQNSTSQTTTKVWSRNAYSLVSTGCSGGRTRLVTQAQRSTETIAQTSTYTYTYASTETVVYDANGNVTSDTKSNPTVTTAANTTVTSDTSTAWSNYGSASTGSCRTQSLPSPNPGNPTLVSSSTTPATPATPAAPPFTDPGWTRGTPVTTYASSGGTSNTLADVAEYYYRTDLRTPDLGNCSVTLTTGGTSVVNDVCANNVVPPNQSSDSASWQHMTTFTLGLGASGYMEFYPNYTDLTIRGDYYSVAQPTTADPANGICSWQAQGTTCTWPTPVSNAQPNIDDLWHAAVNGRGSYYSARDPASLAVGLGNALSGIGARTGASAAATTSNPNTAYGDNFVFQSTFTTRDTAGNSWWGELERRQLDLTSGTVSATTDWTAQGQLDLLPYANRLIYTFDPGAANKLMLFAWNNLPAASQAYFTTPHISTLSQFCSVGVTCLSSADQATASGLNLVNYLRGDRSNEGAPTDTTRYFRQRLHVLGDIVDSEAVYVKKPMFNYADTGYSAFVTANATRQGMVYAAANDGMLHAFNADSGAEAWAYVPALVLPDLYQLADKNYANLHRFFVDGTPVASDVFFGGAWHTILVGGLNGGGQGYYALDVTNPASPAALWEFSDTNMGYTFGNPEITKLKDGTWVVLVASGYNNTGGDGQGRLYVLNAATGTAIRSIATGVGSTATPSGLARIRAWVDNAMSDNTALRVYGGDLLGNLWRFDINGDVGAAGYDAQLLATFRDAGGHAQPITARPELGDVGGYAMVFVGTGRLLGTTDLTDTSQQSFYAVKDTLGTTNYGSPRASSGFIAQTVTSTTCPTGSPATICSTGQTVRTGTSNTVNLATDNGWYLDFPTDSGGASTGERDNTDPTLALGTLGFNTNLPNSGACSVGGDSYTYFLDYRSGAPVSVSSTGVVGVKLGSALATRPVFVRLPNNTIIELTRLSDSTTVTKDVPISPANLTARRVSWRELVTDH